MEVPASFAETVHTYLGKRVRLGGESEYGTEYSVVMVGLTIDNIPVLVVRDRHELSRCIHLSPKEVEVVVPKVKA